MLFDNKKKKALIIPKGTINPNQNNVIEIPVNIDDSKGIVVKSTGGGSKPNLYVEPLEKDDGVTYKKPKSEIPVPKPRLKQEKQTNPPATQSSQSITPPKCQPVAQPIFQQCQPIPQCQLAPQPQCPRRFTTCQEAPHSPLCPICDPASRFLSGLSCQPIGGSQCPLISNRFSSITNPFRLSSLAQCPPFSQLGTGLHTNSYNTCSRFPLPIPQPCQPAKYYYCPGGVAPMVQCTKSESFVKEKKQEKEDHTDILSKIIEDKIDQVLRPLILSLLNNNQNRNWCPEYQPHRVSAPSVSSYCPDSYLPRMNSYIYCPARRRDSCLLPERDQTSYKTTREKELPNNDSYCEDDICPFKKRERRLSNDSPSSSRKNNNNVKFDKIGIKMQKTGAPDLNKRLKTRSSSELSVTSLDSIN